VLAAAAQAWEAAGLGRVVGITPSQSARNTLAAGVPVSYHSAQFLGHLPGQRGARGPVRLRPGDLVLIDEASMVANPDLADVISQAATDGAKIILAGDTQQLQAVENGGGMSLLADALGSVQLTEPTRFRAAWEQDASLCLHSGDTTVLAEYDQHGRIRGGEPEQMMDAAVADYLALTLDGTDTLLMAADHALRRELSRRVREDLIRLGAVQPGPAVTIADGATASAGDLIICTSNDRTVQAGSSAARSPTATCSASKPSPHRGSSSAGRWPPTRAPASAAGPTAISCSPAIKIPSWAMRSPTTSRRAVP
jgi:ATP-dependent exoDNAse (exonuclease V) alpha subunit